MLGVMSDTATALPRSPEMMNPQDTGLLVIDVQERLLPAIPNHERLVWNIRRLLDGAAELGIARAATEQNPDKLGPTATDLAARLDPPPAKFAFSGGACGEIFESWRGEHRHRVLVCGIETHVCVLQTVLDLLAEGFSVYVAADAVASRNAFDQNVALRRMESSGATLTTVEAALFEWCGQAGTDQFRRISTLVKETGP